MTRWLVGAAVCILAAVGWVLDSMGIEAARLTLALILCAAMLAWSALCYSWVYEFERRHRYRQIVANRALRQRMDCEFGELWAAVDALHPRVVTMPSSDPITTPIPLPDPTPTEPSDIALQVQAELLRLKPAASWVEEELGKVRARTAAYRATRTPE